MQCEIDCEKIRIENLIRDAVWSAGADGVVIGVSGGVDSAVALALATGAVSGERVTALFLPSVSTPHGDELDVQELCSRLGVLLTTIPIDGIIDAYRSIDGFENNPQTIGNLMARTRMALLYYHANRTGRLVTGTSNKTEYLIGYCTKWGDNAADIQPILHLYKKEIYLLAEALQIPRAIISKKPSAGLWPGQSDEDEIGITYPELDSALESLELNGWKADGHLEERVLSMVKKSTHKRVPALNLAGIAPRSL
ncbi:NAD+ synthase [Methanocalculus sp.]|uniref:NAD+ synthase n=1 Tax=Methanocalculus sp. TaxID=2004547 RepID=UPI002716EA1A|nr:NAD+ synthase [Methanocalculus sp.]MDO8841978.1 NAD+ synthase [Methanocalculus sp.]